MLLIPSGCLKLAIRRPDRQPVDDKDVQPLLQLSRAEGVDSKDENGQGIASDEDFIENLMRPVALCPRCSSRATGRGRRPSSLRRPIIVSLTISTCTPTVP